MAEPYLTTFIGDEIQGDHVKWSSFVDGGDGFFSGIPYDARCVVKFNPLGKSLTEIGPDLGEGEFKWTRGVIANNVRIYCIPRCAEHMLKINTNDGTVESQIIVTRTATFRIKSASWVVLSACKRT